MRVINTSDGRPVSDSNPFPVKVIGGGGDVADGSITTDKIADGAVTDDKLATSKIDKPDPLIPKVVIGTTLETNVLGLVGYSQSPTPDALAMYQFGGQLAVGAPQSDDDAATKQYVDSNSASTKLSAVDAIDDPATATTEDIANKINEILAALKG